MVFFEYQSVYEQAAVEMELKTLQSLFLTGSLQKTVAPQEKTWSFHNSASSDLKHVRLPVEPLKMTTYCSPPSPPPPLLRPR